MASPADMFRLWTLLLWLAGCAQAGVLESESGKSALAGTHASHLSVHTLLANITITPVPGAGQPWCEAQVGVDGEPCFSYDCQSDEVKPFCVLGLNVKVPLKEEMRGILKDLTEEFRGKLLDVKPKDSPSGEPLSLQATLVIQEANVPIHESWQFVINRRISLHLNLMNKTWTVDHPGDTGMLEQWKKDKYMNDLLWRKSHGDCRKWLQRIAVDWKMLGTTAPLSMTPGRDTSKANTKRSMLWLFILVIPVILIGFMFFKLVKKYQKNLKLSSWVLCPFLASSLTPDAPPDQQELQSLQQTQTPAEVLTEGGHSSAPVCLADNPVLHPHRGDLFPGADHGVSALGLLRT